MDKRKTAYHEAGHAVAHHRLFPRAQLRGELTIIPNQDENAAGSHTQMEHCGDTAAAYQAQVQYLCSGYAACVAAGIHDEAARVGCWDDFEKAEEIIAGWKFLPLEDQLGQAIDFMRLPDNLRAVERLATELLDRGTLDGDEVEVLIEVADEGTAEAEADLVKYRVLRDHCRMIE